MKKLLSIIVSLLFFINFSSSVFAQDSTSPLAPSPQPSAPSYKINDLPVNDQPDLLFTMYDQPKTRINGNTRIVWVQFTNLDPSTSYAICAGFNKSSCKNNFKPQPDGTITLSLCGNGEETAKGVQVSAYGVKEPISGTPKLKEKCKEEKDYFHEGHSYKVSLFSNYDGDGDRPDPGKERGIVDARFFVAHSYPLIKINSEEPNSKPVAITLWGRRPGGDSANNYQVVVEGTDNGYKNSTCYSIPEKDWWVNNVTVGINTQFDGKQNKVIPEFILNGTGFDISSPRDASLYGKTNYFGRGGDKDSNALGRGTYVAKINERVNDERPLGLGKHCEGGLTYMHVFFQVSSKGIQILKVIYDPNSSDGDEIEKTAPIPKVPCAAGAYDEDTDTCKAFNVALLGKVPLDPLSFIKSIYTIALSIAGLGAMAIIIKAGYKFMYSRGDKEAITQARSELTSAIIGLAFIIFAYVILSVIGVDILKIPGFG